MTSRAFLASTTSLTVLLAALTASAADWPQWRGSARNGNSTETGLLKAWPAGGPKRVWMFENAGLGYSGPAIVAGKMYTMGTRGDEEVLLALDANTGKEVWAAKLGPILSNDWGNGPRGTPAVDGNLIYAMSGKGDLSCVQAADGKVVWTKAMTALGGKRPNWGYTESVLVDGDLVLCTPGGAQGAMAALDKKSGKVVWQSKDFTDEAHYSSIIPIDHDGKHQYVQLTSKSVVGINAKDGKTIWRSEWPGKTAVIPTPIYKDGHVFVVSGYGVGCKLIKLGPNGQASDVYENKTLVNHHGGVILVGDFLYGHSDSGGWTCQNFKTGATAWQTGRQGLGKGAIGYADGMLYCLEESSGNVVLIELIRKPGPKKAASNSIPKPPSAPRVARFGPTR
jgi:outer membrane protein assembly factor BamB